MSSVNALQAGMDAAVRDLRAKVHQAQETVASTRYYSSLARSTAAGAVDNARRLVDALDVEGRARVLSGEWSLSQWQSIANDAAELLRSVLGFSGKWSAGSFFGGVATDVVGAVPKFGAELGSLTRWAVVGVVAVAAIYIARTAGLFRRGAA